MYRVLPGLPTYGELARGFPSDWGLRGHEGFVVEFSTATGGRWVGNFANGMNGISKAVQHPDGVHVLVFSGGDCWSVDVDAQRGDLVVLTCLAFFGPAET